MHLSSVTDHWATVAIAIVATVSGVIASMFAVSRVLAMISEMGLVPHRHLGMPGNVQKHTLVYTVVIVVVSTMIAALAFDPRIMWDRCDPTVTYHHAQRGTHGQSTGS